MTFGYRAARRAYIGDHYDVRVVVRCLLLLLVLVFGACDSAGVVDEPLDVREGADAVYYGSCPPGTVQLMVPAHCLDGGSRDD